MTAGKKVLVVDDEPMTRDLLRLMLERAGFEVMEATDGLDALDKVKQQMPDVVLLDVMMPNMDGYVACKHLRQDKATAGLPVIMLSARASAAAVAEGLDAGATKYLIKPVGHQQLVKAVSEVLDSVSIGYE